MRSQLWNLVLGVLSVAASAITLIWWIPNDIESGVLVQDRYSINVGDALAPTAIAIGIFLIGAVISAKALLSPSAEPADPTERTIGLSRDNAISLLIMLAALVLGLLLMTWAGPLTVNALQWAGYDIKPYRLLTDTRPYKFIGFALGGFVMVLWLISWVEGRVTFRGVLTAVGAVVALIIVYDVPFDSLLLPPNGGQ